VWSPVYVNALILRDELGNSPSRIWAVQDANWNVVALVNDPGAVVERYAYTPFGEASVQQPDGTPRPWLGGYNWLYRFQGGRYDPVTGTTFFQNRHYDPRGVRWTTPDPLGYAAGDMNLYRFVGNNPTSNLDPSGTFGIYGGAIGAAFGFGIQLGYNLITGEELSHNLGTATLAGFVSGFTGGATLPLLLRAGASTGGALFLSGAAGGVASYGTESLMTGRPITAGGVVFNGLLGGGLGYGLGKLFKPIGTRTAPRGGNQYVSLLDDVVENHVLKGDRWGSGGHYWLGNIRTFLHGITGKKSMFPITWSRQRILHEVSDVATSSSVMRLQNPRAVLNRGAIPEHFGSRVVDGVNVAASVRDGRIVSGYPLGSRYFAMMKPVHQQWGRLPLWSRISIGVGVPVGSAGSGYLLGDYLFGGND